MKHYTNYQKVIAIKEMANGNESVGSMWLETASFDKATPISEIIKWADHTNGRLIITIDDKTSSNEF